MPVSPTQPDTFITEFFTLLKDSVRAWITTNKESIVMGDVNVSNSLESYVNYINYSLRDEYCRRRSEGERAETVIASLITLPPPADTDVISQELLPFTSDARSWTEALSPLRGREVFYANFERMAHCLIPWIRSSSQSAVIISENEIDYQHIGLPPEMTAVRFHDLRMRLYRNDFIEKYFPVFYSFCNTVKLVDSIIEPPRFSCICGCQVIGKIWAEICAARGGDTVCYQHGWPAFMHTGFVDMPYKRMVTWGDEFNRLWRSYNPQMECLTGGYPYPIAADGSHQSVTFFLQEPYFVSSHRMVGQMYDLIVATALRYPDMTIQYRLHPESQIDYHIRHRLDSLPNVVDTTDRPLHEVYASTRVAVSHYSSTIIECIAHGCCPLVFNPTPGWSYTPDLEAESIGFISTTPDRFFDRLPRALAHRIAPTTVARWIAPPRCEPDS
ncbi:hypothetical protein [Paramuribaculum intestinale]|uniref:hypothetical protein n=1 Tax=Paramuribaculum intestinale TaxID=2094151 RepID=UPI0025AA2705|nr:hypothetical protein [Paramuribaculum intestinale]